MIKHLFISFILLFGVSISNAQNSYVSFIDNLDTVAIYKHAFSAPISVNNNPEKLAIYLTEPFKDTASKVLAISYWITQNITYKHSSSAKLVKLQTAKETLKSKKAVSKDLSKLFVEMCTALKIKSLEVTGYVREFDTFDGDTLFFAEHSWNLVQINKQWHIVDLTLASTVWGLGSTKLASFLWRFLRISKKTELRPIQIYDRSWIGKAPSIALETHFPNLPIFQLLKYPLFISEFEKGDTLVKLHVARYPQGLKKSKKLEKFYALAEDEKHLDLAENVLKTNPNGNKDAAINYFLVIQILKAKSFLPKQNRFFCSKEDLKRAYQYSVRADSLFILSGLDANKVFDSKKKRSEKWKADVLEYNKMHLTKAQALYKSYIKQDKDIVKLEKQLPELLTWLKAITTSYNALTIANQIRPGKQNNADLYVGMDLLSQADSVIDVCKSIELKYNTVIGTILNLNTPLILENQKKSAGIHKTNVERLRNYVYNKTNSMPMVYYSNKSIRKEVFSENLNMVDSLNSNYADTIVSTLTSQYGVINSLLKDYQSEVGSYLKLLQSAKSKIVYNNDEDAKYIVAVNAYVTFITKVTNDLTTVLKALPDTDFLLLEEMEFFEEEINLLKKDNTLEGLRHKQYVDFLKKSKKSDLEYVKYYINENKALKKIIQKSLL